MSTTSANVDVVIAGAGPAGLSTWLHLHSLAPSLAASTIVIEKARHPREKLCGGAITPLGFQLLAGLRLELAVPSVPVDLVVLRFGDRTLPFPRPGVLRIVHRAAFDAALAKAAVARGLTLHEEEQLEGFAVMDGGLRVTTNRGEYQTRALVGADGVFSRVRQSMRLDHEPTLARLLETVRPASDDLDIEFRCRAAVFDFSAAAHGLQGYAWHFPCLRGDVPSMNHGIFDARLYPDRTRVDLRAVLGEALRERGVTPPEEWAGHPVRWLGDPENLSRPHVFLIGDAAGVDTALGEGIAQALDYGDLAANVLIDAFKRDDFSFGRYAAQLAGHPLGQGLSSRHRLATALYRADATEQSLEATMTTWLSSSSA